MSAAGAGGGHPRQRGPEPAEKRSPAMRKFLLTLVLAGATVAMIGLTPSKAEARWWNRGYVSSYYYPAYSTYYYPSYSYGYSAPAYSSYYSAPVYSYGSYYTPTYTYGSYYTPSYYY